MKNSADAKGISWMLVKYESLVNDATASVEKIAQFLGVDVYGLQVEKAENLPVYGSSQSTRVAPEEFEWKITEKPKGFRPIGRWRQWDSTLRDRFKCTANDELIALGYEKDSGW